MEVIVRMLELRARKWGRTSQPATSPNAVPTPINQFLFEEMSMMAPDDHIEEADGDWRQQTSGASAMQQPVTNPG